MDPRLIINQLKSATLPIVVGWTTLLILPSWFAFLEYNSHNENSKYVDPLTCNCNCWDEILKGPQASNVAYKHIYLNATGTSLKILILLTTGAILLYESVKHLTKLFISKKIRYSMAILFLVNVYPHIFIWWSCINNLNDGIYGTKDKVLLLISSGLFCCTITLHLSNSYNQITYSKLATILSIGLGHLLAKRAKFISTLIQISKSDNLPTDRSLLWPDFLNISMTSIILIIELNKNERFGRENKMDMIFYASVIVGYYQLSENL